MARFDDRRLRKILSGPGAAISGGRSRTSPAAPIHARAGGVSRPEARAAAQTARARSMAGKWRAGENSPVAAPSSGMARRGSRGLPRENLSIHIFRYAPCASCHDARAMCCGCNEHGLSVWARPAGARAASRRACESHDILLCHARLLCGRCGPVQFLNQSCSANCDCSQERR